MDTVKQALIWIVIAAATSPIWGALLWVLWQGSLRPRLIPRAEIDARAAEMLARHGPRAKEVAAAEEEYAWRNSQPFEQGRWRRVRKRIERLETSAKK
ncbi:MAG TPA: hypothetical protein VL198_16215 [Pseudolabrys sp.]|jgi:hypothetical protein|nr:hypothetical protein [Pseudolabrys sp.]